MREKFDKLVGSRFGVIADKFINSPLYSVAVGAVCLVSHFFDIPVVGAVLLALLLVPALLFCKNSFTLAPFLLMCAFVMSRNTQPDTGYYNTPLKITALCLALVFVAAALIFNLTYFGKWKKIFKRSYLTVSLALVSGVLVVGGVGTEWYTLSGMGMALAIAITMYLPYSLLVNCGEYNGRKTVEYFAFAVIVAAFVIGADFLRQYVINDLGVSSDRWVIKDCLKLGFVGPNTGSAIITLAIPLTFYLVYVYKHGYLFVPLIALDLLLIVAAISRASFVIAAPGTFVVAVALCFKKKDGRLGYWIAFGLACLAVMAVAIVFRHKIAEVVKELFSSDFTGTGRTTLWIKGFEAWKGAPVFGIGLWYLRLNGEWFYSFHCTPLTYLYCAGVVGLLAYGYHRYKTVRLTFSAKLTAERVFVALTVLAMLLNALLDIAMTSPTHLLYYGVMLALIECDVKKTKADATISASADDAAASVAPDAVANKTAHKK